MNQHQEKFQTQLSYFMSPNKNQWRPYALSYQHSSADEVKLFGAILERFFWSNVLSVVPGLSNNNMLTWDKHALRMH